ncbi:hypothetical protein SISNIDRAFT_29713 [Sistotremastrum niveocremeum HHB9708]|uniref:Uncharacterized protein n=1 Tax=Sistotremastrum niveocremeum HHB9708 TaxID=1314777 RepID=A0A164W4E6_9AGAM|nr:hypothetical protein SISNIDRAFT_29713 [Sistotremastrum niveocremeum HHB9708]
MVFIPLPCSSFRCPIFNVVAPWFFAGMFSADWTVVEAVGKVCHHPSKHGNLYLVNHVGILGPEAPGQEHRTTNVFLLCTNSQFGIACDNREYCLTLTLSP